MIVNADYRDPTYLRLKTIAQQREMSDDEALKWCVDVVFESRNKAITLHKMRRWGDEHPADYRD